MDESRARTLRSASVVALIVGLALMVVGTVGFALSGGNGDTTSVRAADRAETTETRAVTPTTAPPTTTTTVSPRERVVAFFADWSAALRNGDANFLFARLHPAVAQRYGDDACRAYLATLRLPQASAEVLDADAATATWSWETDGRSTPIPDALAIRFRRTEDGTTFTESPAHIAFVDGDVRWFTDCGTPKES